MRRMVTAILLAAALLVPARFSVCGGTDTTFVTEKGASFSLGEKASKVAETIKHEYRYSGGKTVTIAGEEPEYWIFMNRATRPDGYKGDNDLTLIFDSEQNLKRVSTTDDKIRVRFGNNTATTTIKILKSPTPSAGSAPPRDIQIKKLGGAGNVRAITIDRPREQAY